MRYYAWDDVHLQNDLAPEFAFTRAYQLMSGKGLAAREAACLAVSLPAAALPIEEGDWFVGRRVYRPLGISPSYWNDETDGLDHVSYYADLDRLTRVMNRADQTPEQKSAIAELIDFWSDEHVNAKVRKKFDPQMRRELPTDYWTQESAVVFGLYRLAGAQLNYDLLVQKGLPGMRQMLEERLTDETLDENQKDFLQGLLSMLDTLRKLLHRYEAEVESMLSDADDAQAPRLRAVLRCVKNLQNAAPSSFMEAIQIVWLYASFSGTLDFGRLDVALGDWYCHDLDEGVIDQDQALTLLLSFYRLMHQIISRIPA